MKNSISRILFITAVICLAFTRFPPAFDSPITDKCEDLFNHGKYEQTITLLKSFHETNPDDPDVYWMMARSYYRIGESIPIEKNKQKKLRMYKLSEI